MKKSPKETNQMLKKFKELKKSLVITVFITTFFISQTNL